MNLCTKKHHPRSNRGAAMIISMVFIVLFSALSVSLFKMTSANLQIAANQHKLGLARASADSGLEYARYWMSRVYMPGTTQPADRFTALADYIDSDIATTNQYVTLDYDAGYVTAVHFPAMQLDSTGTQSFHAVLTPTANLDVLELDVVGNGQALPRKVRVNYLFGTRDHSVFDYGVATRGPLSMSGNILLEGVNISVESDVYIESLNDDNALSIIGNSQIAGEVKIVNPNAQVDLQGGQAGIGGETGQDAIDNHVEIGVPPTEFPLPMPNYFLQYIDGDIDMNDTVHTNVRIPPNTNPSFAGGTEFEGVLFIEVPNVVVFSGHVTITGLIVGNGDLNDDSGANRIEFLGTVDSFPVTDLPADPAFDGLHDETGTFLMAPGFAASFGGDFETINGAIAANGIEFWGNAGGVINGSVVNYADTPMLMSGNADLQFNRSGITDVPAGFGPEIIMHFIPSSYIEVFEI